MLRKAKINVMAVIGMMVAIGTVAFTAPEKNVNASSWYMVEEVNNELTLTTESTGIPSAACPLEDAFENELCAVGINQSGLSGKTLQELDDEEISIEESRFKEPEL